MAEPKDDDFFVGYLALPVRSRAFLAAVAAASLVLLLSLGALASALRDAPAASQQRVVTLSGRLDARGYGLLWSELDGALTPILIAGGGKFGVPAAARQLFGRDVEARGLLLTRSGYHLLELTGLRAQDALAPALADELAALKTAALGKVSLIGEIVDIKCWLGRMKPGDGRTHRACAQFCIHGGIPPVLVTRGAGQPARYVLIDPAGAPLNEAILPFVAQAVRVEGEAERVGDMLFLRVDPAHIRRP
jgi:hypothetical protein